MLVFCLDRCFYFFGADMASLNMAHSVQHDVTFLSPSSSIFEFLLRIETGACSIFYPVVLRAYTPV